MKATAVVILLADNVSTSCDISRNTNACRGTDKSTIDIYTTGSASADCHGEILPLIQLQCIWYRHHFLNTVNGIDKQEGACGIGLLHPNLVCSWVAVCPPSAYCKYAAICREAGWVDPHPGTETSGEITEC